MHEMPGVKVTARPAPIRRRRWAMAAASLLVIAGGLHLATRHLREPRREIAMVPDQPSTATSTQTSTRAGMEGVYRQNVRFAVAAAAPVIVGTGGAEPIDLGSEIPYSRGGDTLHVWDYRQSPRSRVFTDTRLWADDRFAVSPDGKLLVWASGKILDLATGEQSTIDLGGAFYTDNTGGHLRRIQDLQFSPDGRRLALLLTNVTLAPSTHPLRKQDLSVTETIQVIDFPAGKLLCEFPAGDLNQLRIAFSRDGRRVVSKEPAGKSEQQVIARDAGTGAVIRKYEPWLRGFGYETTLSDDGTRLAVYDGIGEVMIWDAATGELKHRVRMAGDSAAHLRFSPDGKWLAVSRINKAQVIDVASGAITAMFPQTLPGQIHWANDGQSFDVITFGSLTENLGELLNAFPAVKNWKVDGK
jgi:WD40 repeat protein